jgi:hypothetical protein
MKLDWRYIAQVSAAYVAGVAAGMLHNRWGILLGSVVMVSLPWWRKNADL